jgi:hypothetical protein
MNQWVGAPNMPWHCTLNPQTTQSSPEWHPPMDLILAMVLSASAGGPIVGDSGLPLVTS